MGAAHCPLSPQKQTLQSYSVLPADDLAFARAWLAAVPVRVISSPDRLNTRPAPALQSDRASSMMLTTIVMVPLNRPERSSYARATQEQGQ